MNEYDLILEECTRPDGEPAYMSDIEARMLIRQEYKFTEVEILEPRPLFASWEWNYIKFRSRRREYEVINGILKALQ